MVLFIQARRRKEFLETIVPLLREPVYTSSWENTWGTKMSPPMMRGLDRAEARLKDAKDEDKGRHQRRLERLSHMQAVVKNAFPHIKAAVSAQEPAAVIVHGDFCRNNISFHYGDDGLPDRVCLFDFQTSRYRTILMCVGRSASHPLCGTPDSGHPVHGLFLLPQVLLSDG